MMSRRSSGAEALSCITLINGNAGRAVVTREFLSWRQKLIYSVACSYVENLFFLLLSFLSTLVLTRLPVTTMRNERRDRYDLPSG